MVWKSRLFMASKACEMGAGMYPAHVRTIDLTLVNAVESSMGRPLTQTEKDLLENPGFMQRVKDLAGKHPMIARALALGGTIGALAGPAAADSLGNTSTIIDDAFTLVNQHVIPGLTTTVQQSPALVVTAAIVVTIVIVALLVPGSIMFALRTVARFLEKIV